MLETETGAAQQSIMTSTWEASEQKELARTFEQLYCFQCVRLADSAFRCSGHLPPYHITPPIKFVSEQWMDSHRDRSTLTNADHKTSYQHLCWISLVYILDHILGYSLHSNRKTLMMRVAKAMDRSLQLHCQSRDFTCLSYRPTFNHGKSIRKEESPCACELCGEKQHASRWNGEPRRR